MVLMSITTPPRRNPSATPFAPSMTCLTCCGSGSMVTTTSLAAPTSFGDPTALAPTAVSRATASALKSYTVSGCPRLAMFCAMGPPMTPNPINPTFSMIAPRSNDDDYETSAVFAPLVHLPNGQSAQVFGVSAHKLRLGRLRAENVVRLLHQRGGAHERFLHLLPGQRLLDDLVGDHVFGRFEHGPGIVLGRPIITTLKQDVVFHDFGARNRIELPVVLHELRDLTSVHRAQRSHFLLHRHKVGNDDLGMLLRNLIAHQPERAMEIVAVGIKG